MENRFAKAANKRQTEREEIKKAAKLTATTPGKGVPTQGEAGAGENTASLMIYLPPEVKQQLKIYAATNNKSIAVVLREWIVEKLNS